MYYSTCMKRFIGALCLLFCAAWIYASDEPVPDIKTESVDLAGNSALLVRSAMKQVDVWLDMSYKGTVPVDLNGLKPGKYILLVKKIGYYDRTLILTLAANTRTTVTVELQLITGFINFKTDIGTAFLDTGIAKFDEGLIELAAGKHTFTIRAFGYQDQELDVFVPERATYDLSVTMEKALFEVSEFSLPTSGFNPRNSGIKGKASIYFYVTAPGFARLSVVDKDGNTVHEARLGPFDTWEQDVSWDGKDTEATQVPDGAYTVTLEVEPGSGIHAEQELFTFNGTIQVDSTIILVPRGMATVLPGPSLAYGGFVPGMDSLWLSGGLLTLASGSEAVAYRAVMAAGFSIKDRVDAGIGFQLGIEPSIGIARAGVRYGLKPMGFFSLGAALDGTIAFNDAFLNSAVRLAFPLSFGTRFLHGTLCPEIGSFWEPAWAMRMGGSAALVVADYLASAELSARLISTVLGTEALGVSQPVLLALDVGFLPPSLPLALGLHGQVGFGLQTIQSWEAGIYIGANF